MVKKKLSVRNRLRLMSLLEQIGSTTRPIAYTAADLFPILPSSFFEVRISYTFFEYRLTFSIIHNNVLIDGTNE